MAAGPKDTMYKSRPTTRSSQNTCTLPPFVEFDMSAEGFGCLYLPSIAPQSANLNALGTQDSATLGGIGSGITSSVVHVARGCGKMDSNRDRIELLIPCFVGPSLSRLIFFVTRNYFRRHWIRYNVPFALHVVCGKFMMFSGWLEL